MYRLLFCVLLFSSAAGALPMTMGRTGVSEFHLRFAKQNFPLLLMVCRQTQACSYGISDLIRGLENSELHIKSGLNFLTGRELGNHLYRVDAGSVISVNRDMLFIGRNGGLEPYIYPDAVSFLAKVWAELLGWPDFDRSIFAHRLSEAAANTMKRSPAPGPYLRQFHFSYFPWPVTALLIEDASTGEQAATLEVPFVRELSCGPSTGVDSRLQELRITKADWDSDTRRNGEHALLSVSGTLSYICPDQKGERVPFTSKYNVRIDAQLRSRNWVLIPASLRIQQNGIRASSIEQD